MAQQLGNVTFLVRDHDEAIAFFTVALGFQLLEDIDMDAGKRWVVVAPRSAERTGLLWELMGFA